MVDDLNNSTLWEVWGNTDGFLGGTTNHAWSGGGLTVLSQFVCGIAPIESGYSKFQVAPQPGGLNFASAKVESVKGMIEVCFSNKPESFVLEMTVPETTSALVKLPGKNFFEIRRNGKIIWKEGDWLKSGSENLISFSGTSGQAEVLPGKWIFKAR